MRPPVFIRIFSALLFLFSSTATRAAGSSGYGMEEEVLFGDIPVVYLVSKKVESSALAPAAITVYTADDLERMGIRTITEALKRTPGFYPDRQAFHDDLFAYRGYAYHTNDKMTLLLDGHNISNFSWTSVITGDLDELMSLDKIERIEIIHGPGSIMWGSNALLTVINLVTKTAEKINGLNLSATYGDFRDGGATYMGTATYGYKYDENVDLSYSLHVPTVNGWNSANYNTWFRTFNQGTAKLDNFDTRFQSSEFWAKARVNHWTASFRAVNSHQNVSIFQHPVGVQGGGSEAFEDSLDVGAESYALVLNGEMKITDNLESNLKIAYDKYLHNFFGFNIGVENPAVPFDLRLSHSIRSQNVFSTMWDFRYSKFRDHDIAYGVDFIHEQFHPGLKIFLDADEADNPDFPVIDDSRGAGAPAGSWLPATDITWSAYAQDTWKAHDNLNLILGSRADWNRLRDQGHTKVSPRFATVFHNSDDSVIVKYMLNTGTRRPIWLQIAEDNLVDGRLTHNLKSERAIQNDLEGQWNTRLAKLKLNLFVLDIKDVLVFTGPLRGFSGAALPGVINPGDFRSSGVEAQAKFTLPGNSQLGANFTWLKEAKLIFRNPAIDPESIHVFNNNEDRFFSVPEYTATLWLNNEWFKNYYSDVAVRYWTRNPAREVLVPDGAVGTPSANNRELYVYDMTYVDVTVGGRKLFNDHLSWSLRTLNLFNNRRRIPMLSDLDLYQPAPRYVEGKVTYHF